MKIAPHRTFKYYYLKLIRLEGRPHFLALGVGIGIFVGVTPTIPLHTILALVMALLFRASKIAALLATMLVSNPLTFFLQYYLSWKIGSWLVPSDLSWEEINQVLEIITDSSFRESTAALANMGGQAITTLVTGGCILALPFALLGYLLSFNFFTAVRRGRRQSHILK